MKRVIIRFVYSEVQYQNFLECGSQYSCHSAEEELSDIISNFIKSHPGYFALLLSARHFYMLQKLELHEFQETEVVKSLENYSIIPIMSIST